MVDRSSSTGMQPRAFATTVSGWLVLRDLDRPVGGWQVVLLPSTLTDGVSAVSFPGFGGQAQRAFYVRGGRLRFVQYDEDDRVPGERTLALPPIGTEVRPPVSAVLFSDAGAPIVAVAARVAGSAGTRVCVWEVAPDGTSTPPICPPGALGTRAPDIAGAVANDRPAFFFRSPGRQLTRMVRFGGSGGWIANSTGGLPVGVQTIGRSVAALGSTIAAGTYEVAISSGDRVYVGRVSSLSAPVDWTDFGALPDGSRPGRGTAELAMTTWTDFNGGPRMQLFACTAEGRVVRASSLPAAWFPWLSGSHGPPDEDALACSTAYSISDPMSAPATRPTALVVAGQVIPPFWQERVLQEFADFLPEWRDHIRPFHTRVIGGVVGGEVLGRERGSGAVHDTGETVFAMGGAFGVAATIRRLDPPPRPVVISWTDSNGFQWDRDWVVSPIPLPPPIALDDYSQVSAMSQTDPFVDMLPGSAELFLTTLEFPAVDGGAPGMACPHGSPYSAVVLREGFSPNLLSGAEATRTIVEGSRGPDPVRRGALDHPQLAVTRAADGSADVHIVFQRTFAARAFDGVLHPADTPLQTGTGYAFRHAGVWRSWDYDSEPGACIDGSCPAGQSCVGTVCRWDVTPAAFLNHGVGEAVWSGRRRICRLAPESEIGFDICSPAEKGAEARCVPGGPIVPLGGPEDTGVGWGPARPLGAAPDADVCTFDGGDTFHACLAGRQTQHSVAASRRLPETLIDVRSTRDVCAAGGAITDGNSIFARTWLVGAAEWGPAVRVNPRLNPDEHYFDLAVEALADGTLVIVSSYVTERYPIPGEADKVAEVRAFVSSDGGGTWEMAPAPLGEWRMASLPVACPVKPDSRGEYFLGDYLEGAVLGARVFVPIHGDDGTGHHIQRGAWVSRWARW